MEAERIQKVLAKLGHGSRRQLEAMLQDGKIKVNGKVATLGIKITDEDRVEINNQKIDLHLIGQIDDNVEVLLLHKPTGYLSSNKQGGFVNGKEAPKQRKLVFDLLPELKANQGRWVQVGRLDINTSGLLLFTNNGELANKLMHPSSNIERVYDCRIYGHINAKAFQKLTHGVNIDGTRPAKFNAIESLNNRDGKGSGTNAGKNSWWRVSIGEGRNREVRKIFDAIDVKVNKLTRVQYGSLALPATLAEGKWIKLNNYDVDQLMKAVGAR